MTVPPPPPVVLADAALPLAYVKDGKPDERRRSLVALEK